MIPSRDNELLWSNLKQIFDLESVIQYDIKKHDDNSITVNITSSPSIVIKLDKARNKVQVMSTAGGEFKVFEYDVRQLEMVVSKGIPSEESMKDIVNDAKKRLEQLIYEFVYSLASPAPDTRNEFSYYCEILSKYDRFVKVVEQIYEDRHKGFDRGHKILMNYR